MCAYAHTSGLPKWGPKPHFWPSQNRNTSTYNEQLHECGLCCAAELLCGRHCGPYTRNDSRIVWPLTVFFHQIMAEQMLWLEAVSGKEYKKEVA